MLEDLKDLNFDKRVPSAAKRWCMASRATVSLGASFYVTSTHLWSELIQCIAAPSQSARLASEQLPGSECLTTFHALRRESWEKTVTVS